MPFTCSICEEESTRICVACTKDSCDNHLCEKCSRCSDCCGCEVRLEETLSAEPPAEPMAIGAEHTAEEITGQDVAGSVDA
jgi:hypothetical protein